jgi:hypothetical protein
MARRKRAAGTLVERRLIERPAEVRDWPLFFAHRNGQAAETAAPVGDSLRAAFQACCAGPPWKRRLAGMLQEQAGPELLSQVSDFYVRNGELRLEVAEPSALCLLRLRWEQRLLALLQAHLPSAGITAVRFVLGR